MAEGRRVVFEPWRPGEVVAEWRGAQVLWRWPGRGLCFLPMSQAMAEGLAMRVDALVVEAIYRARD